MDHPVPVVWQQLEQYWVYVLAVSTIVNFYWLVIYRLTWIINSIKACVILAWITIGFVIVVIVITIITLLCAACCCKSRVAEAAGDETSGCMQCCIGGCVMCCTLILFGIMCIFPILNLVFAWPFL